MIQTQGSSSYCDTSWVSDNQFCAGCDISETCQGDNGGPLMANVNNLWTCTGIVSYGKSCGHSDYYTWVSYYRSCIDDSTNILSNSSFR